MFFSSGFLAGSDSPNPHPHIFLLGPLIDDFTVVVRDHSFDLVDLFFFDDEFKFLPGRHQSET